MESAACAVAAGEEGKVKQTTVPTKRTLEPGDRVLICGDHPWTGHTGEFVAVEMLSVIEVPGLRIKLDNGCECFVMEPRHLRRI